MPTSCQDLWRMGHTLSGLYSVMGTEMIESVYCDFTRLPNDVGKYLKLSNAFHLTRLFVMIRFPEMDWVR
jgi:hypothetical protein